MKPDYVVRSAEAAEFLEERAVASDSNCPYIETHSGEFYFLQDPSGVRVHFDDIARSLSRICRFQGHCKEFYSVAQHSVLVAEIVKIWHGDTHPYLLKFALLHDAHEAYMADLSLPLKWTLPDELLKFWRAKEDQIQKSIHDAFKMGVCCEDDLQRIKKADECALYLEAWKNMHSGGVRWMRYKDISPHVLDLLRHPRIRILLEPVDHKNAYEIFCTAAEMFKVVEKELV